MAENINQGRWISLQEVRDYLGMKCQGHALD